MLAAGIFPLLLKMPGVFRRACFNAHQNAAFLDAIFVVLDAFFGDSPTD